MTIVITFNTVLFILGLFLTMATMREESSPSVTASSPQSDAVTNELQELSIQPAPNLLPIHERKNGELIVMQKRLHVINKSEDHRIFNNSDCSICEHSFHKLYLCNNQYQYDRCPIIFLITVTDSREFSDA